MIYGFEDADRDKVLAEFIKNEKNRNSEWTDVEVTWNQFKSFGTEKIMQCVLMRRQVIEELFNAIFPKSTQRSQKYKIPKH